MVAAAVAIPVAAIAGLSQVPPSPRTLPVGGLLYEAGMRDPQLRALRARNNRVARDLASLPHDLDRVAAELAA